MNHKLRENLQIYLQTIIHLQIIGLTLNLKGSHPNPKLEVTLNLMGSNPDPNLKVTLTLMGSYPNPNGKLPST